MTTLLNKNGWRLVNPPIAGSVKDFAHGQLIARDDKTGLGVLRKQDGVEIKIHVQWFAPLESKEVSIKSAAKPTRVAKVDPMRELLEKILAEM